MVNFQSPYLRCALVGLACFTLVAPDLVHASSERPPSQSSAQCQTRSEELVGEAAQLYRDKKLDEAVKAAKGACESAPDFWLPHAVLAYLYFQQNPEESPYLEESARSCALPHQAVADLNFAKQLISSRMYGEASEQLAKLISGSGKSGGLLKPITPDTKREASLLRAFSLANGGEAAAAQTVLESLEFQKSKSPEELLTCARIYALEDSSEQQADCARKGLKLLDENANGIKNNIDPTRLSALKSALQAELFKAAVIDNDKPILTVMLPDSSQFLPTDEQVYTNVASMIVATTLAKCNSLFEANGRTAVPAELMMYAKIFEKFASSCSPAQSDEKSGWCSLEKRALELAFAENSQSTESRLALAAFVEKTEGARLALAVLSKKTEDTEGAIDALKNSPFRFLRRGADLERLLSALPPSATGYTSNLSAQTYAMPTADCLCKFNSARVTLKRVPGVIDVIVGRGSHPVSILIYDRKVTEPNKILADEEVKNLAFSFRLRNNEPVDTISKLSGLYAAVAQSPPLVPPRERETIECDFPTAAGK